MEGGGFIRSQGRRCLPKQPFFSNTGDVEVLEEACGTGVRRIELYDSR